MMNRSGQGVTQQPAVTPQLCRIAGRIPAMSASIGSEFGSPNGLLHSSTALTTVLLSRLVLVPNGDPGTGAPPRPRGVTGAEARDFLHLASAPASKGGGDESGHHPARPS